MFVFHIPSAEDAGTTPELNASNAHIPLQWAQLATREAGIGAGLAKRNRAVFDDNTVNPAYSPEGEVLRAMANARLTTLESDVYGCPPYVADFSGSDAATYAAFVKMVNEAAAKNVIAETDTNGQKRGKALRQTALSKVAEIIPFTA